MILILPYHLFKISEILKNLFNNGLSNPININIDSSINPQKKKKFDEDRRIKIVKK